MQANSCSGAITVTESQTAAACKTAEAAFSHPEGVFLIAPFALKAAKTHLTQGDVTRRPSRV